MKKMQITVLQAFITTTLLAFSFTFAQGGLQSQSSGFFGDMSIRIYCTFSNFIPGSNNSACNTDVLVNDRIADRNAPATSTTVVTTPVITDTKIAQINGVINSGLSNAARIVYVPVKGERGRDGTTTVVYQTVYGAPNSSPAAYIYAGGNSWTNPYQTTVPGDIHSTFIHFLKWETATGDSANITNINASNTYSVNLLSVNATSTNLFAQVLKAINGTIDYLVFTTATGTNLQVANASTTNFSATGTSFISNLFLASSTQVNSSISSGNATLTTLVVGNSTTTNLFSTNASITEATTTYFFAAYANFLNLFVQNLAFQDATGTRLQVANASTTNFSATGTSQLSNALLASSTLTNTTIQNAELKAGNATVTTLVSDNATSTNFFTQVLRAFNAQIDLLTFTNATGTDLQVANASTTNFSATGTSRISALYLASSTQTNTNILSGNATLTNLKVTNASLTNATTTTLFANLFRAFNATIDSLIANAIRTSTLVATTSVTTLTLNASTTNATTSTSIFLNATNATLTNATITNLRVVNCAEGNVLCNGGNDTGAIVGLDTPLTLGTLNAAHVEFITGDAGFPSVTPGSVKLVVENMVEGTGAVRVTNNLKVGQNITASGTLSVLGSTTLASTTVTNITGNILAFATGFISTLNSLVANIVTLNSTIGNINTLNSKNINATGTAYITNVFATTTNASTTNTLNLFATGSSTLASTTVSNLTVTGNFSAVGPANLGTTTVYGSLIPSASTTYHDLGSALNPWHDLYLSPSTIYLGSSTLSVKNGILTFGGLGFAIATSSPTATSTFGVVMASSSIVENATSTNLFATIFSAISASINELLFTNATGTNATTTNLFANGFRSLNSSIDNLVSASSTLSGVNILSGNATLTAVVSDNATSTNMFATNLFATNIFSTIANIITLNFTNATGTTLQVGNGYATNFTATGTSVIANLFASSTNVTNLIGNNATYTNISSENLTSNGNGLTIGTQSNNLISFVQNSIEAMRIKITGDISITNALAIGRSTPSVTLHVGSSTMAAGSIARFQNTDGTCNINPVSGLSCSSDERLKKNIEDSSINAVDLLNNVAIKEYNMLNQADGSQKQVGFIAQNLETVFPWLVQTDEEGYKSVSYSNVTPILVKAIKEMKTSFFSEKVTTNQLCIGNTCIVESDLQEFLQYKASQQGGNQGGNVVPDPAPQPPTGGEPEPAI